MGAASTIGGGDESQGSTHSLSQGGVPLSSCKMVMEDRALLTDSQERSATLLLQSGMENRVLPTAFCCSVQQKSVGRGSNVALSWCSPGEW